MLDEPCDFTMPSYDDIPVGPSRAVFPKLVVQHAIDVPLNSSDYFHAMADCETLGTTVELSAIIPVPPCGG